MNKLTVTSRGPAPEQWNRAEWVTISRGVRMIRYEVDFDLTCLLRNLTVACALAESFRCGRHVGRTAELSAECERKWDQCL